MNKPLSKDTASNVPAKKAPLIVTNPRQIPVKVKLMMDDVTHRAWIDVRVGSHVKPNLWSGFEIEANQDQAIIRAALIKGVNETCNHMGRMHGDTLDSREIVSVANECLDEIFSKAAQAQKAMR